MKGIHSCQWKLLLYTYDGSTVGKRIWLAAQVADKLACKRTQPMLLESDNVSVAAAATIKRLCTSEKVTGNSTAMSLWTRLCGVGSERLTSLVHIQLGFV